MATQFSRQFAGPTAQLKSTVSCIPHYKDDVDKPWVNMGGMMNLSVWLHPKSTMTLEEVTQLIEGFLRSLYSNQTVQAQQRFGISTTSETNMKPTILSMSFRGETTARAQMATLNATDYLHDQEPFNLSYELALSVVQTVSQRRVTGFCFPCCCFWMMRDRSGENREAEDTAK